MIKLYWCEQTRSTRALWMLEELGQPFEIERIDIRAEPRADPPEFLKASPMGKVPAIVDGAVSVSDSAAICLYLADRYPAAGLAPATDHPDRGSYLYWMTYTPGVIEPAMNEKFAGGESNRFRSGWGDFPTMLETLAKALGGKEWLLGPRFSAADVMVGSSANFLKMFGMLPEDSGLDAYVERCLARPAYQRAMARDAA